MENQLIVVSDYEYLDHAECFDGICLSCQKWNEGGVEPDAVGYKCTYCGAMSVMGAEEALLSGFFVMTV